MPPCDIVRSDQTCSLIDAALRGHVEDVASIMQISPEHAQCVDGDGRGALHYASSGFLKSHIKCVELLIADAKSQAQGKDKFGDNALMSACQQGRRQTAELLLNTHLYEVNERNKSGRGSLHLAVQHGYSSITELLLEHGAVVNITEQLGGCTPLMWTAFSNHTNITDTLLKHQANVNLVDRCGRSALHYACMRKSEYCMKMLLKHGAECGQLDHLQQPPLHHVMDEPALVRILLCAAGKDRSWINYKHPTLNHNTLLHFAMGRNLVSDLTNPEWRRDYVVHLLEAGVCVNTRDIGGCSPLELAVAAGHRSAVITLLLQNCDLEGISQIRGPMSTAVINNDSNMVSLLYKAGASLSPRILEQYFTYYNHSGRRNSESYQCIKDLLTEPRSLGDLCRCKIRSCIGPDIEHKVHNLGIPNSIKDFLLFSDVFRKCPSEGKQS